MIGDETPGPPPFTGAAPSPDESGAGESPHAAAAAAHLDSAPLDSAPLNPAPSNPARQDAPVTDGHELRRTLRPPLHPSDLADLRDAARQWAAADSSAPSTLPGDLALVLSELVTNSVQADAGHIDVALRRCEGYLELTVRDDAGGWPTPREAAAVDASGRGLLIVDVIARQWGVTTEGEHGWSPASGSSKLVWAHLATGAPDPAGPG